MPEAFQPKLPSSKLMKNTTNSVSVPSINYPRSKSTSSKPLKPKESVSEAKNHKDYCARPRYGVDRMLTQILNLQTICRQYHVLTNALEFWTTTMCRSSSIKKSPYSGLISNVLCLKQSISSAITTSNATTTEYDDAM